MPKTIPIRHRQGHLIQVEASRQKAIRLFCTECLGWETHPKHCTSTECPLYTFRGQAMDAIHAPKPRKEHPTL